MPTNKHGHPARLGSLLIRVSLLLITPLLWGCSSDQLPVYPVQGTVRFADGTFPKFGEIEFYNAEHKINARGKINRDGSFTVGTNTEDDGAVAGTHQIIVFQVAANYLTEKYTDSIKHDHGALVHTKFFDYRTSGLECQIVPGVNPVDLVVEKLPRQTSDGLPKH